MSAILLSLQVILLLCTVLVVQVAISCQDSELFAQSLKEMKTKQIKYDKIRRKRGVRIYFLWYGRDRTSKIT